MKFSVRLDTIKVLLGPLLSKVQLSFMGAFKCILAAQGVAKLHEVNNGGQKKTYWDRDKKVYDLKKSMMFLFFI